jgi:ElaB/YqjD/DUF883 family membrane-anchored ribosome-binding protein
VGGHVAGRLAGFPRKQDGMLHGLVAFGLTTLIGFYLLTSGLGQVIGGAGSLVSSVVNAAGKGAASAAPGLVDSAKQKLQEGGADLSAIQDQVDQLLRETGKPQLQPENLQNRAQGAVDQAQNTAQNPADLKDMVSRVFGQNGDVVKAADRDALINVIMSRTGKSRPEAEQIVNSYQQTFQHAKEKAQQLADQAKAKAMEAADAARKGAAQGALASTAALLLGALAAGLGGRVGTPREMVGATADSTRAFPHSRNQLAHAAEAAGRIACWLKELVSYCTEFISFNSFANEIASSMFALQEDISQRCHSDSAPWHRQPTTGVSTSSG